MKRTYICGNCGARFVVDSEIPKGCPVCWTDRVTPIRNRLSSEDSLKVNLERAEDLAKQIAEVYKQNKKLRKEYMRAYSNLKSKQDNGSWNGKIPMFRDYL